MTRLAIVAVLVTWSSIAVAGKGVTIAGNKITLAAQVYFETAKPVIKAESHAILDQLAAALVADKKIALVEIQGHTDSRGNDEWNLQVSEKRAQAIQSYLVSKGVDASRLRAKGYGETKPLDKRANAKAWAKNRRMDFVILQRTQ